MPREKANFREVYGTLLEKYGTNIIFAEQVCEILNCKKQTVIKKYQFLKVDEDRKRQIFISKDSKLFGLIKERSKK